ncbi:MAG: hypothetical protein RLP44_27765 [Aggregatilineales bacterium]
MGTAQTRIQKKKPSAKQKKKSTLAEQAVKTPANVANLHRLLGNQGVQRLLSDDHTLQREEPQSTETKKDAAEYKEAGEKLAEAIKETDTAKAIIEKAKEEGGAFISTLHGGLIGGTALAVLIAALHVNDSPLPISEIPIPLEKVDKSLKDLELKIEYESDGSPLMPEKVMLTFVYTPGKAAAEKERKEKAKQKLEEEIIALRKSNEQFRQMLMTPEERKREQEMLMQALNNVLFPQLPDVTHGEETKKDVQKEMPDLLKMRP